MYQENVDLSYVLADVVRSIAADQIIIEQLIVSSSGTKQQETILARNKFNITLLNQLLYLMQIHSDSSVKAVSMIDCLQKAVSLFDPHEIRLRMERNKPLIDVLADKKTLISILASVLCLMKLENLTNSSVHISLRRRGPYVSVKLEAPKPKLMPLYRDSVLAHLSDRLVNFSGQLDWRLLHDKRVVYIRLSLSKQIPLDYNS